MSRANCHCQLMFYSGGGVAPSTKPRQKPDACVSPQRRRCRKPPPRLSLREPRQPPQQPPRRTGAWPTPPPPQGSRRAAGERPERLRRFQRRLLLHLWSPSLCPSAFARPPRKETSCGLRPRGGCWWSDLAPKEREVNSAHLHLGGGAERVGDRTTALGFIGSIRRACIRGLFLLAVGVSVNWRH